MSLCSCLDLGLFMSYLCDLFFIMIMNFIMDTYWQRAEYFLTLLNLYTRIERSTLFLSFN